MRITICDVGPRDGLQNQPISFGPEIRAELANRLAAAGVGRTEAVSFVNPARVPTMAEPERVVELLEPHDGVVHAGLVLNERGYDRLRATALTQAHYAFAATDEFQARNANATTEQGVEAGLRVLERAHADGRTCLVALAVSFGCPFSGRVDPARVLGLAERFVAAGADELSFADTIGVAVPREVRALVRDAVGLGVPVGIHLHNTRNTGIANALAAIEAGATTVDASVGGIGGCPFAPRATGNICTEDLIYLLDGEGIETGVDVEALIEIARWVESLLGKELEGQVYKAGTFARA